MAIELHGNDKAQPHIQKGIDLLGRGYKVRDYFRSGRTVDFLDLTHGEACELADIIKTFPGAVITRAEVIDETGAVVAVVDFGD